MAKTFHLKQYQSRGQWYWSLIAPNGRKIACGGEGYENHKDCEKAIERVLVGLQATVPCTKADRLAD